jgi:hypothetical protein
MMEFDTAVSYWVAECYGEYKCDSTSLTGFSDKVRIVQHQFPSLTLLINGASSRRVKYVRREKANCLRQMVPLHTSAIF